MMYEIASRSGRWGLSTTVSKAFAHADQRGVRVFLTTIAAAVAVLLPFATGDVAQQFLMSYVAIICLLALSLHLLMGLAGIFSLGQAAFFGFGAYLGVILIDRLGIDGVLAMPLVGVGGAILGLLMGAVTLRTNDIYLALATLAFGYIGENIVRNSESLGAAQGLLGFGLKFLGSPLEDPKRLYWVGLFFVFLLAVIISSLRRSKIGRALMASRESPVAASSIGIDTQYYRLVAFAIAGCFSAVAGTLYTIYSSVTDPSVFGLDLTLAVLTITIVGGLRSMTGVLIAAIALTYFRNSAETFGVAPYALLIYGLLVVATLRFLPQGLGGSYALIRAKVGRRTSDRMSPDASGVRS